MSPKVRAKAVRVKRHPWACPPDQQERVKAKREERRSGRERATPTSSRTTWRTGTAESGASEAAGENGKHSDQTQERVGIPRADMPQVKAEHRGALVNS